MKDIKVVSHNWKKKHHNLTRQSITSRSSSKKKHHRTEVSAGGLVFKRTKSGVFFAMLKDSFGNWTFSKGHVRRGESYAKAAEREIFEELGLKDLRKIRKLGSIDIWFRDRFVYKGKLVHKYIHYFLFEAQENSSLRMPKAKKTGEKIKAVQWVSAEEVLQRSKYKDMLPIIRAALVHLKIQ